MMEATIETNSFLRHSAFTSCNSSSEADDMTVRKSLEEICDQIINRSGQKIEEEEAEILREDSFLLDSLALEEERPKAAAAAADFNKSNNVNISVNITDVSVATPDVSLLLDKSPPLLELGELLISDDEDVNGCAIISRDVFMGGRTVSALSGGPVIDEHANLSVEQENYLAMSAEAAEDSVLLKTNLSLGESSEEFGGDQRCSSSVLRTPNTTRFIKSKKCNSTSEMRYYKSSFSIESGHQDSVSDSSASKSVKSLSALSKTSWLQSSKAKKVKKRSLNALFDMIGARKAVLNRSDCVLSHTEDDDCDEDDISSIPRANSATFGSANVRGLEEKEEGQTPQLTRLATSDLRDLERRFHSFDRIGAKAETDEDVDEKRDLEVKRDGKKPSPHPQAYYTVDPRRMGSRRKKGLRDKKLLYGVKQFNVEPNRGIRVLIDAGFLQPENPKDVARFLFSEGRLSKKQIGKFIGGHEKFNQEVLREFVRCHEFFHLILVQALRQFLWSFRLPGEAMQIDRVMQAFADHYCARNPDLFEETDTCYILSFSIIMLNTALHNPNVKQRITIEQFVRQNAGINSGKDLPRDILEQIYRSIKEEPFKIPDETYDDLMYTFFSPEKEGWLMKQGGSWKNWKRRWFLLSDRCLYYFQHTAENVPKGIIPLENIKVRLRDDIDGRQFCFELYSESNMLVKGCKTDSKGTVVQGNHKAYRMSASSAEDRNAWLQVLHESIREHPFHDIIASKKAALRRRRQQIEYQNHLALRGAQQQSSNSSTPKSCSSSRENTPKKQHSSVLQKVLTPKRSRDLNYWSTPKNTKMSAENAKAETQEETSIVQ